MKSCRVQKSFFDISVIQNFQNATPKCNIIDSSCPFHPRIIRFHLFHKNWAGAGFCQNRFADHRMHFLKLLSVPQPPSPPPYEEVCWFWCEWIWFFCDVWGLAGALCGCTCVNDVPLHIGVWPDVCLQNDFLDVFGSDFRRHIKRPNWCFALFTWVIKKQQ